MSIRIAIFIQGNNSKILLHSKRKWQTNNATHKDLNHDNFFHTILSLFNPPVWLSQISYGSQGKITNSTYIQLLYSIPQQTKLQVWNVANELVKALFSITLKNLDKKMFIFARDKCMQLMAQAILTLPPLFNILPTDLYHWLFQRLLLWSTMLIHCDQTR